MNKVILRFFIFLNIIFCVNFAMYAQVTVYNNFGDEHEGWDYNYQMGWTVAGENVPSQFGVEQAMSFTSTEEGFLSDIWLGMFSVPDNISPDTVYVRLALNPDGLPPEPAHVLEEWVITGFPSWHQWDPPVHLEGNGMTVILEDESYWIWLSASDESNTGWCMNIDPGFLCPHTLRREGEDWLGIGNETASAFRVDVQLFGEIDQGNHLIVSARIDGNYPNPFNPETTISFYTSISSEHTDIAVYNLKGQKVRTLVSESLPAGHHKIIWNGKGDNHKDVASGVYYCIMQSGDFRDSEKMILIK